MNCNVCKNCFAFLDLFLERTAYRDTRICEHLVTLSNYLNFDGLTMQVEYL